MVLVVVVEYGLFLLRRRLELLNWRSQFVLDRGLEGLLVLNRSVII